MSKYYRVHCDFESFSWLNLLRVGADRYARHHSTEVLMLAWAVGDGEVKQWVPREDGEDVPQEFLDLVNDPYAVFFAWNKAFEYAIFKNVLGIVIPHNRWRDPMVLAYSLSLPGSLDKAGKVLKIAQDKQKLADGKALIRVFCQRRKPSKHKPWRVTTAEHEPEKWEKFKEYNRNDVEAERASYKKMLPYNMPKEEWKLWQLDQIINDKGIPFNMRMVDNAVEVYEELKEDYLEEMAMLTGLENPNSPAQLLGWLQENGYPFDDLKKGHVKRARARAQEELDEGMVNDVDSRELLVKILDLRLEASQSSATKFQALQRAVDRKNGVLRNSLQFAGAGRTWRWAGRIFQAHNLPRPAKYIENDLDDVSRYLETADAETMSLLYDKPMEVLKSCIRPAARAPEGYTFVVADLNAIENRVLGWLADCPKILNVFKNGQDPYIAFACDLFGGTYAENWNEYKVEGNSTKRTISKPGVLGCFGTDTPVLTDAGWKRIVEVRHDDLVFDGENFVPHGGVAFRGRKSCEEKSRIWATPDHKILTEKGWTTWGSKPKEFQEALDLAAGQWSHILDRLGQQGQDTSAFVTVAPSELSPEAILYGASPQDVPHVQSSKPAEAKWRKDSGCGVTIGWRIGSILRDQGARIPKTPLTSITGVGEFVCGSGAPMTGVNTSSIRSETPESLNWIESTTTGTMSAEISDWRRGQCRTATRETWDIINAGPKSRYVVLTEDGPVIVSNCGYMLGAGEVKVDRKTGEEEATGLLGYAWNMGVTEFTKENSALSVETFRREFSEVKTFWYEIEKAAKKCVRTGRPVTCRMLEFDRKGPFLRMRLPSGRYLHYCRPRIQDWETPWGEMKPTLTYEGLVKNQWKRQPTHPGKLTENADQAISRDLLAHGMMNAHKRKLDLRLHVHDEMLALSQIEHAESQLKVLIECMEDQPAWATGLPLGAAGFISPFFTKD